MARGGGKKAGDKKQAMAKGKKGKKDRKKKKQKKKKEPPPVEIIELEPEPLLEEFILEPTSDSEHEREPCIVPAALHMYYHVRDHIKTDSELAMELTRENQPIVDLARLERSGHLRGLHRSVMTMVSFYFKIPVSEIEDGVLECDEHIALFDSVFDEGGRQAIVFCYTVYNVPDPDSSYKTIKKNAIAVTTGLDRLIDTACIIFYRTRNNFQADARSLVEEYFYKGFNLDDQDKTTAAGLDALMRCVVSPCIAATSYWGELNRTRQGLVQKKCFQDSVTDFEHYMTAIKSDVDSTVTFEYDEDLYNLCLLDANNQKSTALQPDKVEAVETTVQKWVDNIKNAQNTTLKIRSDFGEVPPEGEVEYWRRLMARYTSIMEFCRSDPAKSYINFLLLIDSYLVPIWISLVQEVRVVRNEVMDVIKRLNLASRSWPPIQNLPPDEAKKHIPHVVYTLRLVFVCSPYFNTAERAAIYLCKISNQLVKTCINYISEGGSKSVWVQSRKIMENKVKVCNDLHLRYVEAYRDTTKKMELLPGEAPLACSESHIFSKLELFKVRLDKILDFIEKRWRFSVLNKTHMDGIEDHVKTFKEIFNVIPSRTYNELDYRNLAFDDDYKDFIAKLAKAVEGLTQYMTKFIKKERRIETAIMAVERFEKLDLPCFDFEALFDSLLPRFRSEIEERRDEYNQLRSNVPIPWNNVHYSGYIKWVRSYVAKIQSPMKVFKEKECIRKNKISQKVIQMYNSLLTTFIFFEEIQYRAWKKEFPMIEDLLNVPVLRKPQKGDFELTFDKYIVDLLLEAENFLRLNLKIPYLAQVYLFQKRDIIYKYEFAKFVFGKYSTIKDSVPNIFINLVKPQMRRVEVVFIPCFSVVTWASLNLLDILKEIDSIMHGLEVFLREANDIKEGRIEEPLLAISNIKLIHCDPVPVTAYTYLKVNVDIQSSILIRIQADSENIESAVVDLINKFVENAVSDDINEVEKFHWFNFEKVSIKSPSQADLMSRTEAIIEREGSTNTEALHEDCMEVFNFFNQTYIDAIIKSINYTLWLIEQRTMKISVTYHHHIPLLRSNIILEIPTIRLRPPLVQLEVVYRQVIAGILNIPKKLVPWGTEMKNARLGCPTVQASADWVIGERPPPLGGGPPLTGRLFSLSGKKMSIGYEIVEEEDLSTIDTSELELPDLKSIVPVYDAHGHPIVSFYSAVIRNKDIISRVNSLQDLLAKFGDDIDSLLQKYQLYEEVWADDRDKKIIEFVELDPKPYEIRECFLNYDLQIAEIQALDSEVIVGPICFNIELFKMAVLVELRACKNNFGRRLQVLYSDKVDQAMSFVLEQVAILSHPITVLSDVPYAMKSLEEIRERFIDLDLTVIATNEVYDIMIKFNVPVPEQDLERGYELEYNFQVMIDKSKEMQEVLCSVQAPMKKELLTAIAHFKKEVAVFDHDYQANGPMVPDIAAKEASDRVLLFQGWFDDLWHRFEIYSSGEQLFGMAITDYPILEERKKQFNLLQKLYGLYLVVNRSIDSYFDIVWNKLDIEAIMAELVEYQNRCRKLPKGMKDWPAFIELKKKIDDFNECGPLLEMMANKAMKDRHWERLENLLGCTFDWHADDFTLRNVMEAPLLKYKDDVEDICLSAVKEKDIEFKLKQVQADWAPIELQFATFKNKGELLLKGAETQEVVVSLEDSLMILNSLASNRFNGPFKKEIMQWVYNLSMTGEILENWLIVQNLWMYLEAVFVGGDIAKQMPGEAKRFATIDKTWIKLMVRARELVNVIKVCVGDDTMKIQLPYLLDQLETCQKSLTGYLEQKRLVFPRFFFVSDPSLLEILGQASDSHTIQAHLLGVFENIAQVEFSEKEYDRILEIISREGERIELKKSVMCTGGVENWLGALLHSARKSLNGVISDAWDYLNDPQFRVLKMISSFPSQVGLLGIQMLWTRESEKALLECIWDIKVLRKTNRYFLALLNKLIDQTTKDLAKFERIKFETLITIHVHQRDIFDGIVQNNIKDPLDFEWLKQERFYFVEETEQCIVKITDVDFMYMNEFMGCTDRLVITPLTDRCYITLAQAIGMSMGGAPAGPAGTGKTETTKDMGKSLGKYVVVFNCSDQMDFRGLGRIFKGLAQSGSWGCFDEFNRIELPVLSVAAQQISIVLVAKKERKTSFIFSDGDNVRMDPEFGIFLTMNPGYAGRQELPENLKIMFRTVAMMVPDRHIIIRVKLASCGFRDNIVLSRKFFVLYKLCEEQLSKQVHYDFGLRNILSVLRTLGSQKRANPKETEDTTLMRVLRDMNVSKLVDEDEPLFVSLIDDLFVGLKLTTSVYKDLQKALTQVCAEKILTNHPPWNLKVVQLYETSLVRHGLMTMGPTGSSKTTCIHALMGAMTICGQPHKEMRMNPKAITAPQMFGRLDVATNDWTDGIFSTLWRRSLKVKKTEYVWIVLDGPVDAVWIENLNSVLDDNKTLTLANGDRIVMAPNSKLVFEPDNVDNASPATVSRMGMVFISSSVLPWLPILDGWLKRRSSDEVEVLRPLFDKIYDDAHTYLQTKLITKMKILEALYIRQCTDLLDGLLKDDEEVSNLKTERLFLFAMMWSLGAVLEIEDRLKLEAFFLEHPSELAWPKTIAEGESLFEYYVDTDGEWNHWTTRVEEYYYPTDFVPDYAGILVPNVDNVRTSFLIDTIAKQNKAVLLIGEQGTAKTVMIKSVMSQYDPELHLQKSLNFSSATTPNMFQAIIESYIDKRVGTTYGPPFNRKMTIFIDDINMPVINEWGDQVTNEIVRQLMEQGGFYSLEKPGEFSWVVDLQFLAAMIHPGGGRNDIPPRLKRRFCIFNCTLPSDRSMDKIFSVLGEGYFCIERFKEEIVEFLPMLIPLTRTIWQKTKVKMLPTPAKFHYVFNLRDLSRIWEGMLTIQNDELPDVEMLLKLWKHECTRVIADRFVNEIDREWFDRNLFDCIHTHCSKEIATLFHNEEYFFVDFLRDAPEPTGDEPDDAVLEAPKIYEMIPSWEYLAEKLTMYMAGYNEIVRGSMMDLVFFKDAMIHLMRISRIIRTPRGSAMLVGVGGSGKQSLTRLSSYIANYKIHQITLTRTYNVGNFMDDLKFLYRTAGGANSGISFVFTDNDIKDEAFLEFLNNVLSAGEIANLFAKDELDELLNDIIPIMKKLYPKRIPTLENLYDFFITQSRKNIHLVLCFSPVSEKFRSRSLKFPGLISGCTMDWFSRWPRDALVAVSHHFLFNFEMVCTPKIKMQLIDLMGDVQDEVADACTNYYDRFRRRTYVTPKSFLSFLDGYKTIYTQRLKDILVMENQMKTGLKKLVEAAASVDILKKELEITEKEIIVANKNAEKVLASVAVVAAAAEKVQAEVKVVADRASAIVETIAADKIVAEEKLEAARPALEAAEAALLTIKAADIATVRKLGKPPYLITLIMDAVLVLFQKKLVPTTPDPEKNFLVPNWSESLKVMADTRFLFNLQNFPRDKINGETVDLLKPYFKYPLYTFQSAKQACGNVAGLLKWTLAMSDFYAVNKEVLPLKANLAIQQNRLNVAQKELSDAQHLLQAKEMELAAAQVQFETAMGEKQAVQDIADKCQAKMDAATALITGLSGEQIRWTEQLAAFNSEIQRLVGDVLLLTGFLSYSGPFNQEYRTMLQTSWQDQLVKRKIPQTEGLNLVENLVDTATIGEWNLQGLPNDELSIQNGIIVTKAARFPLLIDPQSQGVIWIRNKEKDAELQVSSLNHKYFRQHLEDCLSLGRPLLIEDVLEELDPVLDNVLEKNYIKIGSSLKVKLADKEVDVHKDFRVYITTKLSNPSYTPEVSARTSIIDFTVTMKGLEDQLLGRVILTEKQELELERTTLMQEVTANKRNMKQLEANLLYKLTTVEGSLIDDVSVIQVLNVTKDTAASVRNKLKVAAATEIKINLAREEFRPVAARGSVLYFLVVEMSMVNCMYQTSLVQFLERFDLSIERSEKSAFANKRITSIIDYLTFEVFRYKARGLYEEHKYLFTLLVALKVDLQKCNITSKEFENFIKGGAALDLNAVEPKPEFKWLTDVTWLNLIKLSELKQFAHITNQIQINDKVWKAWFESQAPEEEILPEEYEQLDIFKKTLIIRAMCPDRVISQSKKYIAASLGECYVSPVILNIETLLSESRPNTPMICFLSMGSDPTPLIETTAKRHELRCQAISMGQGQEVHARKLMSECMENGGWVLLQNCHLGIDYMCELFLTISDTEKIHSEFRLWMTTESHPQFPINLLQICLKFTNEPPQGVKAGLTRTYGTMSQDLLDYSNNPQYLPLLYAISFLHTVVQERRKFGPLGWNIPYEFNFADWYASVMFVQNHLESLEKDDEVSWVTVRMDSIFSDRRDEVRMTTHTVNLVQSVTEDGVHPPKLVCKYQEPVGDDGNRYMIGEVQYGGRVTDDYDKRLLTTFALVWFNTSLFSEEFIFYRGYGILKFKQLTEYMDAIEAMTDNDPPQVYGLHPNANITFQSSTAQTIFNTIISIQPKESSVGTGETRESVVAKQATDMLKKLPKDFDPFEVKDRLKIMGILNPMNIFLRQELDRMQSVIANVRRTLKDLLLGIEGTIIMNEALRDALDNIYDARVPRSWLRGSWASSSIGFWFTELLERSVQYSTWIFVNRPPQFWMTGFFNPQGFLTAMRQEVARAHKGWALDSVTLTNTVTPYIKEQVKMPPSEGVYVYGLYLDGAGWDKRNNRLSESMPKILFLLMPVIHIFAENTTDPKPLDLYTCPVYKRPNRTDLQYITALWLPCKFTPAHWILRGVALLCDIK